MPAPAAGILLPPLQKPNGDTMKTTATPRVRPRGHKKVLLLAALAAVVAVAWFALGEWDERSPAPLQLAEAPDVAQVTAEAAPAWPAEAARPVRRAVPAPVAPVVRAATSDVAARATEEVKAKIEELRGYIVDSCWTGSAAQRASAKLTFNLTFDAQGHEIARGISEHRRAPARALGSCLRKLQGTTLAIAPTGVNVAVSVPVTFP